MADDIEALDAKARSNQIIREYGGRVCDWLPFLDRGGLRPRDEIVGRALVMNALVNINFKAPTEVIASWIEQHELSSHLTPTEAEILETHNDDLAEQQLIDLYWYIEALWALMWVGQLITEMPFDRSVEDRMASLCPNLQRQEGPAKFADKMVLRDRREVFQMLDLYYRLHWWTRDASLKGEKTGAVSLDIIMERRKAIEWAMNDSFDWDDVPLNT